MMPGSTCFSEPRSQPAQSSLAPQASLGKSLGSVTWVHLGARQCSGPHALENTLSIRPAGSFVIRLMNQTSLHRLHPHRQCRVSSSSSRHLGRLSLTKASSSTTMASSSDSPAAPGTAGPVSLWPGLGQSNPSSDTSCHSTYLACLEGLLPSGKALPSVLSLERSLALVPILSLPVPSVCLIPRVFPCQSCLSQSLLSALHVLCLLCLICLSIQFLTFLSCHSTVLTSLELR